MYGVLYTNLASTSCTAFPFHSIYSINQPRMNLLDQPPLYFYIFGILNLFNIIDRGIIPGAAEEFTNFVDDTVETSTPSLFVGLLQSAFIVGFCIASPIFGTLTSTHSPFKLVSTGMTIWILSAMICWLSFYTKSFEVLLLGRVLSGIGEASIACCVPPWIATNAEPESKSRWLSMFYTGTIDIMTAIYIS